MGIACMPSSQVAKYRGEGPILECICKDGNNMYGALSMCQVSLAILHRVFSNVSSKRLNGKMHNHTGYNCSVFLHCVFSNVSLNGLHERMHSHIGCICLTFLHCELSYVSLTCLSQRMHSHIDCIC